MEVIHKYFIFLRGRRFILFFIFLWGFLWGYYGDIRRYSTKKSGHKGQSILMKQMHQLCDIKMRFWLIGQKLRYNLKTNFKV